MEDEADGRVVRRWLISVLYVRTTRRLDASMKIGGATVVVAVEGFELTRSLLVAIDRGIRSCKIRAINGGEMPEWVSFELMS